MQERLSSDKVYLVDTRFPESGHDRYCIVEGNDIGIQMPRITEPAMVIAF